MQPRTERWPMDASRGPAPHTAEPAISTDGRQTTPETPTPPPQPQPRTRAWRKWLMRLGILLAAVLVVRDSGWISLPALGATIIVTHLGLLVWELKYVAASLAYPGLKPARP